MVKEVWKTKKTQGFFGFSLRSQKETKATNTQKPRQNQKKTKHEPQTKHSLKSFVFFVFWFSRVFFDFVNRAFPKSLQILFFVGFLEVFCFFGFSPWILSKRVVQYCFFCFQLVLIVCTATTHKTSLKNNWLFSYMHINILYIYIYTCRGNISKCSEVDLGGVPYIYIYTFFAAYAEVLLNIALDFMPMNGSRIYHGKLLIMTMAVSLCNLNYRRTNIQ